MCIVFYYMLQTGHWVHNLPSPSFVAYALTLGVTMVNASFIIWVEQFMQGLSNEIFGQEVSKLNTVITNFKFI